MNNTFTPEQIAGINAIAAINIVVDHESIARMFASRSIAATPKPRPRVVAVILPSSTPAARAARTQHAHADLLAVA